MAIVVDYDPYFFGQRKTLPSKFTLKVRGNFFDKAKIKRLLDDANRNALSRCGVRIQMAARRGIGQRAPARTKAWQMRTRGNTFEQIGGGLYRNITPYNSGKPRPAGSPVKSWTPKRFLYRSLMFYYQQSRKSVIIGPDKAPWLARLHEFGGSMRMQAYAIGVDQARIARRRRDRGRPLATFANGMPKTGVVLWSSRGIRTGGLWTRLGASRTARYPARPYMGSQSVQTALSKLPKEFRDTISGPGSGRP
jgi:hypothetical protein